jgi:hypothetical protein
MPAATGSRSLGLAVGLDCAATVGLESDRGIGKANGRGGPQDGCLEAAGRRKAAEALICGSTALRRRSEGPFCLRLHYRGAQLYHLSLTLRYPRPHLQDATASNHRPLVKRDEIEPGNGSARQLRWMRISKGRTWFECYTRQSSTSPASAPRWHAAPRGRGAVLQPHFLRPGTATTVAAALRLRESNLDRTTAKRKHRATA